MPRKNQDFHRDSRASAELVPPDRFVQESYAAVCTAAQSGLENAVGYTRRNPEKALFSALATGYVLRLLPTTRILGGVVGLSLALIKPAGLIYGIAKLWHMSRRALSAQIAESPVQDA